MNDPFALFLVSPPPSCLLSLGMKSVSDSYGKEMGLISKKTSYKHAHRVVWTSGRTHFQHSVCFVPSRTKHKFSLQCPGKGRHVDSVRKILMCL